MTDSSAVGAYDAYLLHYPNGSWLAQLADLPGASALGASQDEAVARLTAAIPTYYAWLRQHDEYTPITHDTPQVVVRASAEAGAAPIYGAFFSGDAEPVTDEDLDWWLAVIGWAYDDLEAAAPQAAHPNQRALLEAVVAMQREVVARATGGMAGQVGDGSPDPLASLQLAHQLTEAAFRRSNAEQRAALHEVKGERWSLRRGLRESALLARRAIETLAVQSKQHG